MCRADGLTPKAAEMTSALLTNLREALGRMYDVDPDDIVVGPVDLGPGSEDQP